MRHRSIGEYVANNRRTAEPRPRATEAPTPTRAVQQALGNRIVARLCTSDATSAGPGRALPESVQQGMGAALGADLSQVRVHEGREVRARGAIAYTRGDDLHFAPGRYDPWSRVGRQLLGHELAHVVQQRTGRVPAARGADTVHEDPSLELEAERWGSAAARFDPIAGAPPRVPLRAAPSSVVQCLKDPELTTFMAWVENRLEQMNVLEPHRGVALASARQVGAAEETVAAAQGKINGELAAAWATPRSLLGDTYLDLRNQLRPERPNTADSRSPGSRINCSLVAVAALLGTTAGAVEAKLGFAPGAGQKPTAFLGAAEAANYDQRGGMDNDLAVQKIGTLAAYLAANTGKGRDDAALRREYAVKRGALDLTNDQLMAHMAGFVKAELDPKTAVTRGGSTHEPLTIAAGIAAMKGYPRGTQFLVYLGGEGGSHFVYANNLGGSVHMTDYQPLARGVARSPPEELVGLPPRVLAMVEAEEGWIPAAHPHAVDTATPPPFAAADAQGFTEMCFYAFAISAAHAVAYIQAHG